MSMRIVIECGVAQTRGAMLDGDTVIAFDFAPAHGDEGLPRAAKPGDWFVGRVRKVDAALGAAFIDLGPDAGDAPDGFLRTGKTAAKLSEGQLLTLEVVAAAHARKGPRLDLVDADASPSSPLVKEFTGDVRGPMRIRPTGPAELLLFSGSGSADAWIIDDAGAAARIRNEMGDDAVVQIEEAPFAKYGIDEVLEETLAREVRLPGGGCLTIDETEALTVVDVDTASAASGARMADRVNLEAAQLLPLLLARRAIGGQVVVDFLPPSKSFAEKSLRDAIKTGHAVARGYEGHLARGGLFTTSLPRIYTPLLERATEPAGDGWPAPGRRFTVDWLAKAALRRFTAELRSAPSARLALSVSPKVEAHIAAHPQWTERLAERFTQRFEIEADPSRQREQFDVRSL